MAAVPYRQSGDVRYREQALQRKPVTLGHALEPARWEQIVTTYSSSAVRYSDVTQTSFHMRLHNDTLNTTNHQ